MYGVNQKQKLIRRKADSMLQFKTYRLWNVVC
jgi:hypothetical protein